MTTLNFDKILWLEGESTMTTLMKKDCFPDAIEVIPSTLHIVHDSGEVRIQAFHGHQAVQPTTHSITETTAIMDTVKGWLAEQQMGRVE